ncbi:uncharacterized protein [Euphorbia lathyris]|uniref:uncharacterized protein isoform X1 n=1 Tax=Euphorbia lathyris TaxID=212925 RepID=UPI00331384D2
MSGLSSASKKLVREMSSAQAKPCAIFVAIKEKHPEDCPTQRHIYNYREKIRTESFEGRDVIGQFYRLAIDKDYIHWTQAVPDSNVVTHLFMAHPTSITLFRSYYLFVGMDSTYKTNKYKMSFFEIIGMTPSNKNFLIAYAIMKDETEGSYMWVLQKLKLLLQPDVHPTVIATDRELGLMRPVREVFPHSHHLLCTWHINKDVEDRVGKLSGMKKFGEIFKNSKWKRIIEAPTEAEYEAAVVAMKNTTGNWPGVIQYVETTWLVHKEKFCRAWTNKVLHLGNTTTCRVESSHAQLKQWLNSSTGALDTVWANVHKDIEAQIEAIKYSLEDSRRRSAVNHCGEPFTYLDLHVSHYCLAVLNDELKRMHGLSMDVVTECGCVLPMTHGIPCTCELKTYIDTNESVRVDRIHPFWRSLAFEGLSDIPVSVPVYADGSEDHRVFQSLVEKVEKLDPSMVRSISMYIHDQINPEQSGFKEPEVKDTVRGRPKGNSSTKRNPSAWEYNQSPRGRARSSGSRSSRSRGRSSSSSVHNSKMPGIFYFIYIYVEVKVNIFLLINFIY